MLNSISMEAKVVTIISDYILGSWCSEVKESSEALGTLNIRIDHGVNLLAADFNGKSDPYVVITFGGQIKKTTIKYRTLNPVWNETVHFDEVTVQQARERQLKLEVMDYDTFTSDDSLGVIQ